MAVLKYKSGDTFVTLTNYSVQPIVPVQTTGASLSDVMSQKAVTDELAKKQDASGLTDAIVDAISDNAEVKSAVNNQVEDAIKNDSDVKDAINNQVANAVETSPTVSGAISNVVADSVENSEAVKNAIADAVERSESISSAISNVVADAISDDDAVKEAVNAAIADAISGSSAVTEAVEAVIAEATSGKLDTDSFDTYSGEVATAINAKADATAVTQAIEEATSGKVNASDFAIYSGTVETALNDKVDNNAYTAYTAATATELGNKADSSAVTESINAATSGKVNTTDFATYSGNVDTALASKFAGAAWNSTDKKIYFYDNASNTGNALTYIDGTEFVKDGFLSSVTIDNKEISGETVPCLVFIWNADGGSQETDIPLSGIFDPTNYVDVATYSAYTAATDTALGGKSDVGHTHEASAITDFDGAIAKSISEDATVSAAMNTAIVNAVSESETVQAAINTQVANAVEDSDAVKNAIAKEIESSSAITDAINTVVAQAISEDETVYSAVTEAVASAISDSQTVQDAIDNAVSGKADAEAVTQEIEAATSGKVESSDYATYTAETATEIGKKADTSAMTEAIETATSGKANSADVYLKSETSSKTEIETALNDKSDVDHVHEASAITDFNSAIATSLSENATVSAAMNTAIVNAVSESESVQTAINTQVASAITTNETVQQAIAKEIESSSAITDAINTVVAQAISEDETVYSAVTEAVASAISDSQTVQDAIDNAVSGKADAEAVTQEIEAATSGKLDTDSFATYSGAVNTAIGSKLASSDFETYTAATATEIGAKADSSAVTNDIAAATSGKVNTSDFATYSGNVDTALSNKANSSDIVDFFDDAKYETSGSSKVINFYHGETIKATINADDFIKDGMVSSAVVSGSDLVIIFNTDAGKDPVSLPIADIFDANNYYTTGNTSSSTEISDALATKQDSGNYVSADTFNTHAESTSLHFSGDEKANLDALATNIAAISGISSTNVGNWDSAYGFMSGISASVGAINSLTGTVGTMAFANAADYSSATEVETALGSKADTTAVTNDIAAAVSGKVNTTDFASYSADVETAINAKVSAVTLSSGSTNGTLKLTVNGAHGNDVKVPGLGTMAFVDAASYSSATEVANALGSGFTVSSVTDVIESNELVIATAVNDLNTRKADASAITEVANDVATISGDVITLSGNMTSLASKADLNTVSGKADSAKAVTDYYSDVTSGLTSLANIPTTHRLVTVTLSDDANNLSLANTLEAGKEIHIIIYNNNNDSSDITITLPITGGYITVGSATVKIENAKYGEINIISDGTNMYVRGA